VHTDSVNPSLALEWVRAPGEHDHKYTRGVLGLLTGSVEYPGAALIGVHAALGTGIGMVRYLGPPELHHVVVQSHPEVVLTPGRLDACVVGSGIPDPTTPETGDAIRALARTGIPTVLDAGGLAFVEHFGPLTVLTPHGGELETLRLRAGISAQESENDTARVVASVLHKVVLLKGSTTLVVRPDGETLFLPPATAWLATAGTGDALAGILGALLAAHALRVTENPGLLAQASVAAALIHQGAAALAAETAGRGAPLGGPITASDVCSHLPAVIAKILAA